MASKAPPIVRSSKAFSVEIPEGSSSAKSRKSDVVPGSVEIPVSSDPQFEAISFGDKFIKPKSETNFDATVKPSTDQELSQPNLSFTQKSSGEQLVAIANDSLHDHLVGVAKDNLNDHLVGIANDGLNDHLVGIANDGLKDHLATLPQENFTDNLASLPDNAIEDRFVAIAEPEAPIPLFVSADDDFPDDHMEIEETPELDPNVQALSDEAIADHVIQVNVESTVLADVHIPSANEIRSESASAQPATNLKPAVKKLPAVLTPEMIKQQEVEFLAKQQKMEEFHGRVEAIRNTVNNINAKLDQMSPTESKPTSL